MLSLSKHAPMKDLLALEQNYSAEEWLEFSILWRPLLILQELPDIAMLVEAGMYLPPHQRTMMYAAHLGSITNLYPCSRGTAKTSTIGTVYATHQNVHNPRRNWVTLSATGFRGGQRIFEETEGLMAGAWDSQRMDKPFLEKNVKIERGRDRPAVRGAGKWTLPFLSLSNNSTMQTQDEDGIRGERAKIVVLDEANLVDDLFLEKIVRPFMNVKGNMRQGGQNADNNQIFLLSTVDYTWRAFVKRIEAAREALNRDRRLHELREAGNRAEYLKLAAQGFAKYMVVQFDYTDTFIRKHVTTRDGLEYEVDYPDKVIPLKRDPAGIPFLFRDELGRLTRESPPVEYWPTYGIAKEELETGLFDGSATQSIWLYEQRNVLDHASGEVYLNSLIDSAECKGEQYIIPWKRLPQTWQDRYPKSGTAPGHGYASPCLYTCGDPCVVGVDYAPEKAFCAFAVIRVGPLAHGEFNPELHTGKTTWSNVIWVEQWKKMSFEEMAQKIWEYQKRYNLIYFEDPVSDWDLACRAIGLDNRGGGHGVRDMLAGIGTILPDGVRRIYDPKDVDERIKAFVDDRSAVPMLDNIKSSDVLNASLVDFTIAQMQQNFLYLPKWVTKEYRTDPRTHIAYDAQRTLVEQLRKLQQKPTKQARKFLMPGDTDKIENQKDLWAAFIYAAKQLRAHQIRLAQLNNAAPALSVAKVRAGERKGARYGKAAGAK